MATEKMTMEKMAKKIMAMEKMAMEIRAMEKMAIFCFCYYKYFAKLFVLLKKYYWCLN